MKKYLFWGIGNVLPLFDMPEFAATGVVTVEFQPGGNIFQVQPGSYSIPEATIRHAQSMVSRDDLKKWLDRRPFQPLELELTSGTIVPISHPEIVMLSPTTLVVGIGSDRFGLTDYDVISIDQIAKIRVAAGASTP